MKKKLLSAIAILILVSTFLTSCAGNMKFSKVFDADNYEPNSAPYGSADLLDIENKEVLDSSIELILFKETDFTNNAKYTIYDSSLGEEIFECSDSQTISFDEIVTEKYTVNLVYTLYAEWFYVVKETKTKKDGVENEKTEIFLYDKKGEEVGFSDKATDEDVCYFKDLIRIGEDVYRISDDGDIEKSFTFSPFKTYPSLTHKAGDYYISADDTSRSIKIYDEKLELVVGYDLPSYAKDMGYAVLNNGNVIVQYDIYDGEHADDYTFVMDGTKYQLESKLIKAKSGSVKDIELDFLIETVETKDTCFSSLKYLSAYSDNIQNLARIYPIENKRIDVSDGAIRSVSLSNEGKILGYIDGFAKGKFADAYALNRGYWVITNTDGQDFLVNEKGEFIEEITYVDEYCENFIIFKNKIYDLDLNLLCDMEEYDVENYMMFGNAVTFQCEDGDIMMYANGETVTLAEEDEGKGLLSISDNFGDVSKRVFVIMSEDSYSFDLYNENGDDIYTYESDEKVRRLLIHCDIYNGAVLEINLGDRSKEYICIHN